MSNYSTHPRNNQPPNSNNSQEIDWEELSRKIIEDVSHRLMSHRPHQMIGSSLRFGNNGSFAVDPANGVFYDHKEQVGGGVFQMVMHLRDCDKHQAYQWLSGNGYLDGTFNPAPRNTTPHNRTQRNRRSNTAGTKGGFRKGLNFGKKPSPSRSTSIIPSGGGVYTEIFSPDTTNSPSTIRWHEDKDYVIVALAPIQDFIDAYPDPPEPKQFHLIAIDAQGRKRAAFRGGMTSAHGERPA